VEQSATSMSEIGPAHVSSSNQIASMRHQPWAFAQYHEFIADSSEAHNKHAGA